MTTDIGSTPIRSTTPTALPAPGAGTLAVLALGWLLAVLSSVRSTIGAAPEESELVVTQAALALPAVISASLLAGATVALAVLNLLSRRAPALASRAGRSLGVGVGAGAVTGAATALPIGLGYGGLPSALVLCGAIAVAAALGGLVAGLPVRGVIGAGACGALGVFVVGFAVSIFDGDLLDLFGAGNTAESVLAANAWVALVASLVAGLAAGVLGYLYLRRAGAGQSRWPAYLLAGATPGLLVLLAEAITRLGGARLFELVSAASAEDQVVLNYFNAARFNRAMIVVFVGALVAIFLFGRTLRPTSATDGTIRTGDGADGTEVGQEEAQPSS